MRVEVFIINDKKENVLRVRNGPAFTGGAIQDVFVVRGQRAIKQQVRVGLVNVNYVEIIGNDLEIGDQVIVSDVKDYKHLEEISLLNID